MPSGVSNSLTGSGNAIEPTALGTEAQVRNVGTECSGCKIVLHELVVPGSASDSLSIGDGASVVVSENGSCIVGPEDHDGELLIFDECRRTPTLFGRRGGGPGELGSIRAIEPWRGDSILAFGYGRFAVLSMASGMGRSTRFGRWVDGYTTATLPDDSLVIVTTDHPATTQYSVLGANGELIAAFGAPGNRGTSVDRAARRMVLGGRGSIAPRSFWVGAAFYHYHLDRLTVAGDTAASIDRSPPWFQPYDSAALANFWARGSRSSRPLPLLTGVRETADHLLWLTFAVPADDWKKSVALPSERRGHASEAHSGSRLDDDDGIVEVLDPRTGAPLATVHSDQPWAGIANDTVIYGHRETAVGVQQLVLERIRLSRPR